MILSINSDTFNSSDKTQALREFMALGLLQGPHDILLHNFLKQEIIKRRYKIIWVISRVVLLEIRRTLC
jgi:hypothetical protein